VRGDPILLGFNGSRVALLEVGQYFLTVSGDDKISGDRKDANYLSLYCVLEQVAQEVYPGQLRVERIGFKYGNDTLSMERKKVKVNSRLALTSLPYTKPNQYTITESRGNKNSTIFKFESFSGIKIIFSPDQRVIKLAIIVPSNILSATPTGLCNTCSR
jgi:hypothetical protein